MQSQEVKLDQLKSAPNKKFLSTFIAKTMNKPTCYLRILLLQIIILMAFNNHHNRLTQNMIKSSH